MTRRIDLLSLGVIDAPVNIDEIGIDKVTGRQILSALQQAVVALQEAALRAAARQKTATSPDITLKDYRIRKVQTLFGTVSVRVPGLVYSGRVEMFLPIPCGVRSTRGFDVLRARLSAWMSYRSAMDLLGEMYPVDGGTSPSTALRQVAMAAERLVNIPTERTPDASPISLPLDTTFVRARDTDEHRSLEILVDAVAQGTDPI